MAVADEPVVASPVQLVREAPDVDALKTRYRDAIVVDPMLATGNSAVAAVDRIKETRPRSIRFVALLAAPEGLAHFHAAHPDVPVYLAAIDRQLDEHGYIRPGLGDAGDRLFGTK
jgi:uracil phosphoribosyltransferase